MKTGFKATSARRTMELGKDDFPNRKSWSSSPNPGGSSSWGKSEIRDQFKGPPPAKDTRGKIDDFRMAKPRNSISSVNIGPWRLTDLANRSALKKQIAQWKAPVLLTSAFYNPIFPLGL